MFMQEKTLGREEANIERENGMLSSYFPQRSNSSFGQLHNV